MGNVPKVGDVAPDFELPAVGGKTVKLSDFQGEKNVILSFHPLAFTGICADQMRDLQANIDLLNEKETVALGISVDSVPTKDAWAQSLGVSDVIFLSDFEPKGSAAKKYGIYVEEKGFDGRAVFIVDKEGKISFVKVMPLGEKPDLSEILPNLG